MITMAWAESEHGVRPISSAHRLQLVRWSFDPGDDENEGTVPLRPTGSASASTRPSRTSSTASLLRRKIYLNLEELQQDLDLWLYKYNNQRTHQGKRCQGRTPMDTFNDNLPMAKEKCIGYMDEGHVDGILTDDHLTA
jgi:hypothetical protein